MPLLNYHWPRASYNHPVTKRPSDGLNDTEWGVSLKRSPCRLETHNLAAAQAQASPCLGRR